jgi:hypothetical protein
MYCFFFFFFFQVPVFLCAEYCSLYKIEEIRCSYKGEQRETWEEMGLNPGLIHALQKRNILTPTAFQKAAFPALVVLAPFLHLCSAATMPFPLIRLRRRDGIA